MRWTTNGFVTIINYFLKSALFAVELHVSTVFGLRIVNYVVTAECRKFSISVRIIGVDIHKMLLPQKRAWGERWNCTLLTTTAKIYFRFVQQSLNCVELLPDDCYKDKIITNSKSLHRMEWDRSSTEFNFIVKIFGRVLAKMANPLEANNNIWIVYVWIYFKRTYTSRFFCFIY